MKWPSADSNKSITNYNYYRYSSCYFLYAPKYAPKYLNLEESRSFFTSTSTMPLPTSQVNSKSFLSSKTDRKYVHPWDQAATRRV